MVFVPVANTVRATISGNVGSIPWAHILHYAYTGGAPSQSSLQAGASVLMTQYTNHLGPLTNDLVSITEATLTDIASATGAQASVTASNSGTLVGAPTPANVAFVISKLIGRRYKGGHPRASLPLGVQVQLANANTWVPAFVNAVETGYVAFISATANGGMWSGVGAEVTVHRKLNHIALNPPYTDVVQAYKADAMIGSQRRRIGR